LAGYKRALTEAGLPVDPALMVEASFSITSGADAARTLLAQNEGLTGLFAVNDNTAIGALSAIHEAGLSVPEDISLVGYNDIPITAKLPVPLTTVHVPFDQIATEALEILLADQPGTDNIRKAMPTLIPRKSTRAIKQA
jgi:LacI family transcriptional regulator